MYLASRRVDYLRVMAHQMSQQNGTAPPAPTQFQRNRVSDDGFQVIEPNERLLVLPQEMG
jgi:hypothetical protein